MNILIKISSIFFLVFLFSCVKREIIIEKNQACEIKNINGKDLLFCDEKKLNQARVKTNPYRNEYLECEYFDYYINTGKEPQKERALRCKTPSGYEIIQ